MDNLERFIKENRKEFDDLSPAQGSWDKIKAKLEEDQGKTRTLLPLLNWKLAAAITGILFVFGIGFWTGQSNQTQLGQQLPEEFLKAERYYFEKIETSKASLFSYELNEDLGYQFKKDLVELDSSYQDLKKIYMEKGEQPRLLENMILILQQQSKLLEYQLEIIIKQNEKDHESYQSST